MGRLARECHMQRHSWALHVAASKSFINGNVASEADQGNGADVLVPQTLSFPDRLCVQICHATFEDVQHAHA